MKNIISKRVFTLFALSYWMVFQVPFLFAQEKDPVLLSIGGKDVTRSEFEKIYHKNNTKESANDKKSLQEYMDLYINYKLKVKEAEEMALDTGSSFKNELSGYRKQLAQPYLTDKDMSDKLVREAYERMKTDVRASHLLIKVAPDALPKDTIKAYNRIMKIRDMIIKSGDFAKVARDSSEDTSAKENGGDLGFFTALQMVYPFEDAAFKAKIGDVSMPVRTRFGYHLIKVTESRADQGEVTVAHIMVKCGAKATAEDSIRANQKIQDIFNRLKKGDTFETVAKEMSEDQGSAKNGGQLPPFSTGRMVPEFEKAAFELKKNGDISDPIRTAYGWHILKRIDRKPLGTLEEMSGDLKSRIAKDARSDMGRSSFIAKAKKEYHFQDFPKAKEEMYKVADSSLSEGNWDSKKAAAYTKPMFTLLDKNYTQTDFAKFMSDHQTKKKGANPQTVLNSLYDQFVDETVMNAKESRLEKEFPEFKALMEEYRDGILLFELTDKKVWSKAVKDSSGLKDFYEKNKMKYMWPDRVDAQIFTCATADAAKLVKKMAKKGNSHEVITQSVNQELKSKSAVQSKDGRFTKGENEILDGMRWEKGITDHKIGKGDTTVVVNIREFIPAQPKTLEEAKGLVTADYQSVLEKEWIESLRKKYAVKVNTEVLQSIH